MIVDASAVLAILFDEEDAELFARVLHEVDDCRMSAVTYLEAAIRVDGAGDAEAGEAFDDFLTAAGVEIAPVTVAQARLARQAYRRFGKGRHPAGLNLGDCFAYALAVAGGEPLLCKGEDFARTDLQPAL